METFYLFDRNVIILISEFNKKKKKYISDNKLNITDKSFDFKIKRNEINYEDLGYENKFQMDYIKKLFELDKSNAFGLPISIIEGKNKKSSTLEISQLILDESNELKNFFHHLKINKGLMKHFPTELSSYKRDFQVNTYINFLKFIYNDINIWEGHKGKPQDFLIKKSDAIFQKAKELYIPLNSPCVIGVILGLYKFEVALKIIKKDNFYNTFSDFQYISDSFGIIFSLIKENVIVKTVTFDKNLEKFINYFLIRKKFNKKEIFKFKPEILLEVQRKIPKEIIEKLGVIPKYS